MSTAAVVLIPICGAAIPFLLRRARHSATAAGAAIVSITALVLLMTQAPIVWNQQTAHSAIEWIPQLGLRFSFFLDGLGLFFATLILAMGLLIILYARFYLADSEPFGRFYAVLLLFQAAMLGIVLSDNLLLMLVFWEMTSLTSFLLIGHWSHRAESRQGARMALIVTGGGGLALIGGVLLLGNIAGSYEVSEILKRGETVRDSPLAPVALALILIGAFTKSAQFPFHFWLPNAMAAPTPVSAYLHSATMVKAGIFLLARLWPVFSPMAMWTDVVPLVGLFTMVMAAAIAVFKDDLKQLLAYSTVSHLGLIVMLLGLGTRSAAVAAIFHILNHALFKAALFMSAGIVDHETGSRSLGRLGGLGRLMPITAVLAGIAAASMAGVPFLNGFLSKEMMLEQAAATSYGGNAWLFGVAATAGAGLSVAYAVRFVFATFMGKTDHPPEAHPHDPPFGMWLPMAVLIVPVIAIGVLPWLAAPIVDLTARAVVGGTLKPVDLYLWHGLTPALLMSMAAFVGGILLVGAYRPLEAVRTALWRPNATRIFNLSLVGLESSARAVISRLDSQNLQRYAAVSIAAMCAIGAYAFFGGQFRLGDRLPIEPSTPAIVGWVVLLAACAVAVWREHDRLLLLIVTSAVGLIVSLAFLHLSAPDLALTQISIEVVTAILMLLALNLMPKVAVPEGGHVRKLFNGALAVTSGVAIAALAYVVMSRDFQSISEYHVAQSKPGGGGTNVVNVILVDFRAFDTLGEIMVLGIAGIAIYALLEAALRGRSGQRLESVRPEVQAGEAHSLILQVASRILLPLMMVVGIYIFLRGHNEPGGGFIAGILVGVAYIMQYIASGYRWSTERARFDPHLMIGFGIMLAALSGIGAWIFGYPYLTSTHAYVSVPFIGKVELASVIVFDLGVFMTVVGIVLMSLANLARVEDPVAARPAERAPAARQSVRVRETQEVES